MLKSRIFHQNRIYFILAGVLLMNSLTLKLAGLYHDLTYTIIIIEVKNEWCFLLLTNNFQLKNIWVFDYISLRGFILEG